MADPESVQETIRGLRNELRAYFTLLIAMKLPARPGYTAGLALQENMLQAKEMIRKAMEGR